MLAAHQMRVLTMEGKLTTSGVSFEKDLSNPKDKVIQGEEVAILFSAKNESQKGYRAILDKENNKVIVKERVHAIFNDSIAGFELRPISELDYEESAPLTKNKMLLSETKKSLTKLNLSLTVENEKELDLIDAMLLVTYNKEPDILNEIFQLNKRQIQAIHKYVLVNKIETLFELQSGEHEALKEEIYELRTRGTFEILKDTRKTILENRNKQIEKFELTEARKEIDKKIDSLDGKEEDEVTTITRRVNESKLSKANKEKLQRDLRRLKRSTPQSPEFGSLIAYLETVLDLPWTSKKEKQLTIEESRAVLDQTHYGLDEVKDRIIEVVAVKKLTKNNPVILLNGSMGIGKTTIAESIAKALGKEFVKVALGGVSDESELRGHRRTYIGSMPGAIIKALEKVKTNNPVIVLDEVDKMGASGFQGDAKAALLEILDPSQNKTFKDRYIELEYDLSNVTFILTSNSLSGISGPLLDRCELIELEPYTDLEKIAITNNYLIKKAKLKNGIPDLDLFLPNETVLELVEKYTFEAGVRNLERNLDKICRTLAVKVIKKEIGETETVVIQKNQLIDYLKESKILIRKVDTTKSRIGIVNGLAVVGNITGSILNVQAVTIPKKDSTKPGSYAATGNMKELMKESTQVAYTYLRSLESNVGVLAREKNIHLHFPTGSPKDGNSAGVTITTALISALTEKPVPADLAMTGEITITGHVLAIGGVKEKLTAAYKKGIKRIFLPKENEKDLSDLSEEVRSGLEIVPVENYSEIYEAIFEN